VASKIGTERVCTGCMVEFDLTPLLTTKTDETSENRLKLTFRDLTHFQIRLRTEQMSWVKLASKEYHDASKRPSIVFDQVAWIDYFKPVLTIFWTLYYIIIPPLKIPIFGACLAAFIHKTRKYTWPLMNFVITRAIAPQDSEKSNPDPLKISISPTPASPSLPTPRMLDLSNIIKAASNSGAAPDPGSGLENGLLLRSTSARSLPTLTNGKLEQSHDDLYSWRRSRRHDYGT